MRLPLLFHSGIFIDGRSGRFCRPSFFEAQREHPGVRVALAHLGWPWTDEAIAVGLIGHLIGRLNRVPVADAVFRFDLSFGPPRPGWAVVSPAVSAVAGDNGARRPAGRNGAGS